MPKRIRRAALSAAIRQARPLLDRWLAYKRVIDRIPGLSVGIVYRGKIVYRAGFGYGKLSPKQPVTPITRYRIASISKMFTAIAILQLLEQRRLRLTDPLAKHLGWLKLHGPLGKQTIGRTLSHQAGWIRDGDTSHWVNDRFPSLGRLQRMTHRVTVPARDARPFKYSNFGYALLGEVITSITGQSYDGYVRRHILRPLGLTSTATDFTTGQTQLATGFGRDIPGRKREIFRHVPTHAYAPATGFISNVPDLLQFLDGLMKPGKVLSSKSQHLMWSPRAKTLYGKDKYGYGVDITTIDDQLVIGHGGGFAGFITQAIMFPKLDLGIAALSNCLGSSASVTAYGIGKLLLTLSEFSSLTSRSLRFRKFTGLYGSRWGETLVTAVGDQLLAINPAASDPVKLATRMIPQGKNVFRMESEYRFDSPGEQAIFTGKKGKRVMHWGAMRLKQV